MGRTLPWLVKRPAKDLERPPKRVKSEADAAGPLKRVAANGRKAPRGSGRTPSTSPPPEPPREEFMLDGLENDDCFKMVEDEFLSVAKSFTQHLHHAEYTRLRSLAAQNAAAINSISRPTDSATTPSDELQRRKAAAMKSKAQKGALDDLLAATSSTTPEKGAVDEMDEDAEDDPWAGTSLYGLMTSPQRAQQSLCKLTDIKSSTRAAAGFKRSETNGSLVEGRKERGRALFGYDDEIDDEIDDDDLDGPPHRAALKIKHRVPQRATGKQQMDSVASAIAQTKPISKTEIGLRNKVEVPSSHLGEPHSSTRAHPVSFADPKPSVLPGQSSERIQKRLADIRARKAQREQQEQKKPATLSEIPTFLV